MNQPLVPSQWYYEHQLGLEVRWRHHLELSKRRYYVQCDCRYCQQLARGYDERTARLHALHHLACDHKRVTDNVKLEERALVIRSRLQSIQNFANIVLDSYGGVWHDYSLNYAQQWAAVI